VNDVVIKWAASTAVTVATTFVVSKVTSPRIAVFVAPLVLVVAHRSLDARVAQRLRSAFGS
jgi:hypothetical protein